VIGGLIYWRNRPNTTAGLLERLPADGVVLFADFDGLRRAGLLDALAAPAVTQDPEYVAFVEQTGFDYLKDLDSVLVSFHPRATYFLLRGRFDWKRMSAYVKRKGGTCYNSFCRVQGSAEERKISYFPIHPGVMGMAVSGDEWAAYHLQGARPARTDWEIPHGLVWSVIPASALRDAAQLPAGTRAFARPLGDVSRIALSLSAPGGARLELQLDVTCRSEAAAAALAGELGAITERLRALIALENQKPNPRDLSGVLAAGVFERKGTRVVGRWRIELEFLNSLLGGGS